jgi:hypothetical protein
MFGSDNIWIPYVEFRPAKKTQNQLIFLVDLVVVSFGLIQAMIEVDFRTNSRLIHGGVWSWVGGCGFGQYRCGSGDAKL